MKGLFLDDTRNPEDVTWMIYPPNIQWTIVRTYDDFMIEVSCTNYDIITFDHDIQDFFEGKEYTGYDCLKFLINMSDAYNTPLPKCLFHSKNPIGKENMKCYYNNYIRAINNQA